MESSVVPSHLLLLDLQSHQSGNEVTLHLGSAGADGGTPSVSEVALHVELHVVAVGPQEAHPGFVWVNKPNVFRELTLIRVLVSGKFDR